MVEAGRAMTRRRWRDVRLEAAAHDSKVLSSALTMPSGSVVEVEHKLTDALWFPVVQVLWCDGRAASLVLSSVKGVGRSPLLPEPTLPRWRGEVKGGR